MKAHEKLEFFLDSTRFNIPTREILLLQKKVYKWLDNGVLGAIIYGRPRIGKTRATQYISNSLKSRYGEELPVFTLNAYDHIPTINQFYTDLLVALGHPFSTTGNASVKKQRVINTMLTFARETKYKRIILFIDEAFYFREKDYSWLMNIYNELNSKDVKLTVFMVGTAELKNSKIAMIHAKQQQIVGRFMVHEYEFKGISSIADIQVCLSSYDKRLNVDEFTEISLAEFYFPEAYAEGKRFMLSAGIIMEVFTEIMTKNGIDVNADIPMQYFINLINYCLKTFGKYGQGIYFPDEKNWYESVIESGYIEAERCEIELSMNS